MISSSSSTHPLPVLVDMALSTIVMCTACREKQIPKVDSDDRSKHNFSKWRKTYDSNERDISSLLDQATTIFLLLCFKLCSREASPPPTWEEEGQLSSASGPRSR